MGWRSYARPVLVWLLLCGIWGSTWAFIKVGLRSLPPFTFASVRFIIAIAILLLVASLRRAPLPRTRREWKLLVATGLLAFTVNYGLVFWGEQYISSGLAALLQATIPLYGLLIAHKLLPAEPLTTRRLAGVVIGLLGVGVIFSDQLRINDARSFWGSAAIIVGALAAAYCNVLVKAHGAKFDLTVLVGGQMLCGLIPLVLASLITEGNPLRLQWTMEAAVAVLYLALVGSVAAFMLFYWLVRHMSVTNTQLIALVTPIVAVTTGVIFLDEALTWRIVTGGLCIFTGICLVILKKRRGRLPRQKPAPP